MGVSLSEIQSGGPRVRITELRFRYRRRGPWALDGLSFDATTSRVAVLGPNGAGKTTLLSIMSTAVRPHGGNFEVASQELVTARQINSYRRTMGVVPQHLEAMGGLTCRGFIGYVAWLRGVPAQLTAERVEMVLASVDLSAKADVRVSALSGGMRQRLSLAQALVNEPRLLLLDEPTVSLDPAQRDQFLRLLASIGEDTTVLMTSHVAEDVAAFAQEVVVVNEGVTAFAGDIRAFCGLPASAAVGGDDVRRAYVDRLGHQAPEPG